MADTWAAIIKDWATGVPIAESHLDEEIRDRMTVLGLAVDGDGSTSTIKHRHLANTYANMPAAGEAGRRYFATDIGCEFIDDGTNWLGPINHVPELCEHYFDDFLGPSPLEQGSSDAGSSGTSGWRWVTTSTGTFDIGDTSRSQASLTSGLTEGGSVYVRTSNFYAVGAGNVPTIVQIRSVAFTIQGSTYAFGGLISTYPGTATKPDDGVFFFADGETDANWHAITRVDGADSADTDTGVAFTAGAHFMEIVITGTSEAKFYIDHVLKATHAVAMPTDTMGNALRMRNQGAVTRTWTVDSIGVWAARG